MFNVILLLITISIGIFLFIKYEYIIVNLLDKARAKIDESTKREDEYIDELILDGVVCEACGTVIDGYATGYPRTCENCKEDE